MSSFLPPLLSITALVNAVLTVFTMLAQASSKSGEERQALSVIGALFMVNFLALAWASSVLIGGSNEPTMPF